MSILNRGPLATLIGRLTSARATNLDNLDATVSSRAASATALSTATWTSAKAAFLDQAISSVGPVPPIANGLKGRITSYSDIHNISGWGDPFSSVSKSSTSTWETLLSVPSNGGVISAMAVRQASGGNPSNRDIQLRLKIDGNVVYTSDADLWQSSADTNKGLYLVGAGESTQDFLAFEDVPFSSSFLLEFQNTSGSGGVTLDYSVRYHLTS